MTVTYGNDTNAVNVQNRTQVGTSSNKSKRWQMYTERNELRLNVRHIRKPPKYMLLKLACVFQQRRTNVQNGEKIDK